MGAPGAATARAATNSLSIGDKGLQSAPEKPDIQRGWSGDRGAPGITGIFLTQLLGNPIRACLRIMCLHHAMRRKSLTDFLIPQHLLTTRSAGHSQESLRIPCPEVLTIAWYHQDQCFERFIKTAFWGSSVVA